MDHLYFWQCLLNGHSISSYSWYQVAERETPYKDKTLFIYIFAIRWILDSQRQQRESEKEQNLLLNLICIIYLLFKTRKRAGGERTIERARELFMSGYFYCYRWKFVRKVFVFPLFQCLSGEGSCCIFIRYSNIRSEINTKCDTANRVIFRKYDISGAVVVDCKETLANRVSMGLDVCFVVPIRHTHFRFIRVFMLTSFKEKRRQSAIMII